jgi:hypothetical protein
MAWNVRTLAHAAYITPDADPFKTYLTNKLSISTTAYVQQYITDNIENISPCKYLTGLYDINSRMGIYKVRMRGDILCQRKTEKFLGN